MENFPISNLGGVENFHPKCYLQSQIGGKFEIAFSISNFPPPKLGLEAFWKMLSRISNLGGWKIWGGKCYFKCGKFEIKCYSNLEFGVWKIWGENAISNLEFGVWKIWGGKCYLESRIRGGKFGEENAISNLQFGWVEDLRWKMLLESRILGVENLRFEKCILHPKFGGWKIRKMLFEIAFSTPNFPNLEFGGWKI